MCSCSKQHCLHTSRKARLNKEWSSEYLILLFMEICFQRAGESVLVHSTGGGVVFLQLSNMQSQLKGFEQSWYWEKTNYHVAKLGIHKGFGPREVNHNDKIKKSLNENGICVIIEITSVHLSKDLTLLSYGELGVVVGNRGLTEIIPWDIMERNLTY